MLGRSSNVKGAENQERGLSPPSSRMALAVYADLDFLLFIPGIFLLLSLHLAALPSRASRSAIQVVRVPNPLVPSFSLHSSYFVHIHSRHSIMYRYDMDLTGSQPEQFRDRSVALWIFNSTFSPEVGMGVGLEFPTPPRPVSGPRMHGLTVVGQVSYRHILPPIHDLLCSGSEMWWKD
jgi:hypothetical protein